MRVPPTPLTKDMVTCQRPSGRSSLAVPEDDAEQGDRWQHQGPRLHSPYQ